MHPMIAASDSVDFANYFNLCPTNLLSICSGPLETFVSHCGCLNRQSIIFYCLTVYMTALFLVKRLSRLLRIHQIISQLNWKLIFMIILVLLCFLIIALKWLPKLIKLQSVSWILAEFYFNRGLQRLYTGTCIILQKTINGFLCLHIVFLKSKTYQLILKDVIKLNRNLR